MKSYIKIKKLSKLKAAGIVANQPKFKKFHFMIWISKDVLSETFGFSL